MIRSHATWRAGRGGWHVLLLASMLAAGLAVGSLGRARILAAEGPSSVRNSPVAGVPAACCGDCCRQGCACCDGEFWIVNTRCAPFCRDLDTGVGRIRYWKLQENGWSEYTLDEFVAGMEPTIATTFYIHGNFLTEEMAIGSARRVYEKVGRGAGPFRLVLWSWPAEHIPGAGAAGNIEQKAARSEAQGYYLAWLIDQLDPEVRLSLAGHSYGARTVTAALQALATNRIAGYELAQRRFEGRRPIQAALVAAAMDNRLLYPGRRHGDALAQVDRMLVTVNPHDRTLRIYSKFTDFEILGLTGVRNEPLLGDQSDKLIEMDTEMLLCKAHRWARYANSPQTAARLRPYFFYNEP